MDVILDYWWAVLGMVLLVLLVIWMIVRNAKDQTKFESEQMQSELKPEKHDVDKDIKP